MRHKGILKKKAMIFTMKKYVLLLWIADLSLCKMKHCYPIVFNCKFLLNATKNTFRNKLTSLKAAKMSIIYV